MRGPPKRFVTVANYRQRGMGDLTTNGWLGIERTSGKHWKELSDDYMVPTNGASADGNCIIVSDGQETCTERFGGGHGAAYSIDAWR